MLLPKAKGQLKATVKLVSSKSISNRLLILSALSHGKIKIENLSEARDTQELKEILGRVPDQRYGTGQDIQNGAINAGEGGTTYRFLTAFLAIQEGDYLLNASGRMLQRPVGELVHALKDLGADIEYVKEQGYPPLKIRGRRLKGGTVTVTATDSSQYVSALLLIAPALEEGLHILLSGNVTSQPYIDMTVELLRSAGIKVARRVQDIQVYPSPFSQKTILVESDWSAASYFYAAAALADEAELTLQGLKQESIQGDAVLVHLMENFGISSTFTPEGLVIKKSGAAAEQFEFDFLNHPDLVPAVAVVCAGLGIRGRFYNIDNLRLKESDRIAALQSELRKINADLVEASGYWEVISQTLPEAIEPIDPHNDHRMAMAFAPLAVLNEIEILNPEVVEKSYPGFWDDLEQLF